MNGSLIKPEGFVKYIRAFVLLCHIYNKQTTRVNQLHIHWWSPHVISPLSFLSQWQYSCQEWYRYPAGALYSCQEWYRNWTTDSLTWRFSIGVVLLAPVSPIKKPNLWEGLHKNQKLCWNDHIYIYMCFYRLHGHLVDKLIILYCR